MTPHDRSNSPVRSPQHGRRGSPVAGSFVNPYRFDADRYLTTSFDGDQFCPFGMGHHQCPAADTTMQLASLFVEVYARWRVTAEASNP